MGDFPTGSRCDPQRPKCFAGEYCGNQAICCLRSSYDRRRPPSPYSSDDYPDYSVGNQRAPGRIKKKYVFKFIFKLFAIIVNKLLFLVHLAKIVNN